MKLKLSRQYLEDLSNNFLPFMLSSVESRIRSAKGSDLEFLERVCQSVLRDIDIMFKKKLLTEQQKFKIKLTEAQGIIFLKLLMQIAISSEQFWRVNLRNQIVEQLDKQLV